MNKIKKISLLALASLAMVLAMALTGLTATSCQKGGETLTVMKPAVYSEPLQLAPYLYDITFTDYSYLAGRRMFENLETTIRGGCCSVVHCGNLVGRNLDYYYDEAAEFVVRVPAAEGRYASIGVSAGNMNLTADLVEKDPANAYMDMIPFFTTDGINEKCVFAAINMAPTGDLGFTFGTKPEAETLCATMVVRYVLDNCASAEEACLALEKLNITTISAMGEFHFLIADPNTSCIVEIHHNQLRWSKDAGDIMTNYYNLVEKLTPKACGVERYQILKDHYEEAATIDGLDQLMQSVRYSLSYDLNQDPLWYSEYYGYKWKGEYLTIDTPRDHFPDYIKSEAERYENRTRNYLEDIWITTHESLYDLQRGTLKIYSQEDYTKAWQFTLPESKTPEGTI